MQIYETVILDNRTGTQKKVNVAVLETQDEIDSYMSGRYEALFRNHLLSCHNIFYYLDGADIKNPDKNPAPGTYDFFTVQNARLLSGKTSLCRL